MRILRHCTRIGVVSGMLFLSCNIAVVTGASAKKTFTIDRFYGHENTAVVLVGSFEGILTSGGSLFTNVVSAADPNNQCLLTLDGGKYGKDIKGYFFKLNVANVFKGTLTGRVVNVFCDNPVSITPGESGFFFLGIVRFAQGEMFARLLRVTSGPPIWRVPKAYTEPGMFKDIESGIPGIRTFLNRMILDPDDQVSARASMACCDMGSAASIPLIRKRLTEHLAKTDPKDEHITTVYLEALLRLGDNHTLITYADWLVDHSIVVQTPKHFAWCTTLRCDSTPFKEENLKVTAALTKLANADLGALKKAAQRTLDIRASKQRSNSGGYDEAKEERAKRDADLKMIYAAKIGWLAANPGATNGLTLKNLSPYLEKGAPVPPAGWSYEIGDIDEFPYYVPPLGCAVGTEPRPVQPKTTTETPPATTNNNKQTKESSSSVMNSSIKAETKQ